MSAATTATASASDRVGETVAETYALTRLLGEGGMGAVYEAVHAVTGRRVAVKLMHGRAGWSPDSIARFMREARVATAIKHPNVVDVLDAGTDTDGAPYMVLALLAGESLGSLLHRERTLPLRDVVEIVVEVLLALGAAHAAGVVHRDIKPENVFVCPDERGGRAVKLLDFGISKLTDSGAESRNLTKTGNVLGTVDYMSPEQARGDDGIDGRTDLWSVGVMLYRMLSGVLPFDARTPNLVVFNVLATEPVPLHERAPGVPRAMSDVVQRALEKDPERRHRDAASLARELRAALDAVGTAATVERVAAVGIPAAGARGSRGRVAVLVGVVALVGAAGAVMAARPGRVPAVQVRVEPARVPASSAPAVTAATAATAATAGTVSPLGVTTALVPEAPAAPAAPVTPTPEAALATVPAAHPPRTNPRVTRARGGATPRAATTQAPAVLSAPPVPTISTPYRGPRPQQDIEGL